MSSGLSAPCTTVLVATKRLGLSGLAMAELLIDNIKQMDFMLNSVGCVLILNSRTKMGQNSQGREGKREGRKEKV
jgi:hypothetical protein